MAVACTEDELAGSLSQGKCSPGGQCAVGFECNADDECVPAKDGSAGTGGGNADAQSDAPCANCPADFICCNDACVDRNDPAHCGTCKEVCPGTQCQAGACTNECQSGRADCDKNVTNGCEAEASSCPSDAGTG